MEKPEDVMFSPAVKAEQARLGSRASFEDRDWQTEITDDLRQFLVAIDTFFFATASADGRPYIQHRGGPAGFLKPIGTHMLAFADFAGNRQYITVGNLSENPKAHLFLIDYAGRRRVKLWGEARVVENDPELIARLMPESYRARPEQAVLFTVAWSGILSSLVFLIIKFTVGLRASPEAEEEGLDISEHGERAYHA